VSFVVNGFGFPITAMTRDVGDSGDAWVLVFNYQITHLPISESVFPIT
jgi:hypothetical protein